MNIWLYANSKNLFCFYILYPIYIYVFIRLYNTECLLYPLFIMYTKICAFSFYVLTIYT